MALMEVNFFSKALMRPVTMNVILPVDKVFFGEETEEENKPFKTLYLLHGVMGNYTDWEQEHVLSDGQKKRIWQ